jgi:hypothetical protein
VVPREGEHALYLCRRNPLVGHLHLQDCRVDGLARDEARNVIQLAWGVLDIAC